MGSFWSLVNGLIEYLQRRQGSGASVVCPMSRSFWAATTAFLSKLAKQIHQITIYRSSEK